jgi:hypothetical protein
MKSIADLSASLEQEYAADEANDREDLKHSPVKRIQEKADDFNKRVARLLSPEGSSLEVNYRWLAIVYRSLVLRQFVFNRPHVLMAGAEATKFTSLQSHIFHWYENRAAASQILSLFQIALSENFSLAKCPYFGLTRDPVAPDDGHLYNLSALLRDEFVAYYHKTIWALVKGKQEGKCFDEIDHIIQCACNALLSTAWGAQEATRLRAGLAGITQNTSILRHPERALLASVFCLVVVDPLWKYYYYVPYGGRMNHGYAAIGIAANSTCQTVNTPVHRWISGIFRPLEVLEDALSNHAETGERLWQMAIAQLQSDKLAGEGDDAFRETCTNELCKLLRETRGVEAQLIIQRPAGAPASEPVPSTPNAKWVNIPLNESMDHILVSRLFSRIQPQDIPEIVRYLSDTVGKNHLNTLIKAPFDSELLELYGWLDFDVIDSTRIFGDLSSTSRSDSYHLAKFLKDYFEERVLGKGALRTNETPDGWMCGFAKIEDALCSAITLIKDLKGELNGRLENQYPGIYKVTRGGVGIRIGVHKGPVQMPKAGPLADVQHKVLNHTGHLQKQGAEKFLARRDDPDRPCVGEGKEGLSWVLALSADAHGELLLLRNSGSTDALWLCKRCAPLETEIDPPQKAFIYGESKTGETTFDRVDQKLEVGKVICPDATRVYPYIKDEARAVLSVVETRYKTAPPRKCLDIGAGAGIYSFFLCVEYPEAVVTAIEPDAAACDLWERNRAALGIGPSQCKLVRTTFEDARDALDRDYDLVLFNLPYVPCEQTDTTFLHSDGGDDGLKVIGPVLKWLDSKDVHIGRCVFPIYTLARSIEPATTLLQEVFNGSVYLKNRYNINWDNPLVPNWFVLGYNDEPKQKFVELAKAFPEARRRRDVANWLSRWDQKGYKFVCHTILEMTPKR